MQANYNPLNFPGGKDLVRTLSGLYVDVTAPTADMFSIEDIAHGLAFQCRFAGQLREFYTVAQHSINVCRLAPPALKLPALMHDAAEFILCDLAAPIKRNLPEYKILETGIMEVLAAKFGFSWPLDPIIKELDTQLLKTEYRNLVTGPRDAEFIVFTPMAAELVFLEEFNKHVNL